MIRVIFCFSILCLITSNLKAQTAKKYCENWTIQKDTTRNPNTILKLSRAVLDKLEGECQILAHIHCGQIYVSKESRDSAEFFFNRALKLSYVYGNSELTSISHSTLASFFLGSNNIEDANSELEKARKNITIKDNIKGFKHYYNQKHNLYQRTGDYDSAITYTDSLILVTEKLKDTNELATIYHNKGNMYRLLSNYEDAIGNYLKAIEYKKQINNLVNLELTYYILSLTYNNLRQYDLSRKYAQLSLDLSKSNQYHLVSAMNYIMISGSNRKLDLYDKALNAADSALVYAKKLKSDEQMARAHKEKAWVYFENVKDYDKAKYFFEKSYDLVKQTNNNFFKFETLQGLVKVYTVTSDFTRAKKYLEAFSSVTKELNSSSYTSYFYKSSSEYYEKLGKTDLAMKFYKDHIAIEDSVSNVKVQKKVASLEKQFDVKNKELEIISLNEEKKEQLVELQKANFKRNLYLIAAFLLLSLLIFGFWIYSKLKKQKQELAELNLIKNRLFSLISHDLRSMLIPFQRSGRIVKYHIDNNNYDRAVVVASELDRNSQNLSDLLDNLLNWSLDQMNGYKPTPTVITIKDELSSIISAFNQQAKFKKVAIHLEQHDPIKILFDKGAFHVIFRNLIGNALKYTENGSIKLKAGFELANLNFSVTDSGLGMDKSQVANLFEQEHQTSTLGTKGEKGIGIGLNLVHRFVTLNKGSIKVSSEKRIGTQFDVSFPMIENLEKTNDLESLSA